MKKINDNQLASIVGGLTDAECTLLGLVWIVGLPFTGWIPATKAGKECMY